MTAVVKAIVLREWRQMALEQAQACGVEEAGVDWLLRELANVDRLQLHLAQPQAEIPLPCSWETIAERWQQHCQQQVPLQYLVGWTTWRKLRLKVAPGVLIPRPETELMVDLALEILQQEPELAAGHWVDLGTGSGAIAIALALETAPLTKVPLKVHGVDCSPAVLTIAAENARSYGLSEDSQTNSLTWHLGSWFEPLASWYGQGNISVMLSNPPYIPTLEVEHLAATVRDYEPALALDGGADGLKALDHLLHTAPDYLCPGGVWLVEMMAGQSEILQAKLAATGRYDRICSYPDLAGIDRFVLARTVDHR